MHLTSILPLATAALALPSKRNAQWGGDGGWHQGGGRPHWGWPWDGSGSGSIAYFLDNNPSGSSIVALQIAQNGSISYPANKTSTGGTGSLSVSSTGSTVMTDGLGSQGAVTISDNMIFTVNAGSNTAAMFMIDPENPTSPQLVGEPASTQGEFPISITYSPLLQKACVLNGGSVAGVACYSVDPEKGLTVEGPLRQLTTSVINETTPPSGPPGSAAQVLFNPDSSAVFATVKSTGATVEGSFLVWPVENGSISTAAPINNQIEDIHLDFGFQFLNESTIFLSDPAFGASLLQVNPDFTMTETAHTVIEGQMAVCWTEYEPALGSLYLIDSAVSSLYMLDHETGAQTGSIPLDTAGLFDSALAGLKMYSLAAENAIVVIDLAEERQIQTLDLSNFGSRANYQGMAIWP